MQNRKVQDEEKDGYSDIVDRAKGADVGAAYRC
jgi:hypothetical protein